MCIPDSRYGLTLAWVTSENSTMLLESDILRLFFTGPYLVSSPLCSVSGVDCPSVLPRQLLCSPLSCPVSTALRGLLPQLLLSCPATNSLLPLLSPTVSLLSSHQPSLLGCVVNSRSRPLTTSGYGEIFLSKNPLSGFAPKQTRLLWRPTPIVLQLQFLPFSLWFKKIYLKIIYIW